MQTIRDFLALAHGDDPALVEPDRVRFLNVYPSPSQLIRMSTCIRHFDNLTELNLSGHGDDFVVPLEALCSLPRLEILHLRGGGTIDISEGNWKEKGFLFPHLKILHITSRLTFNILEMCPSLKQLYLCMHEKSEVGRYLEILSSSDCGFAETLEKLQVRRKGNFAQHRLDPCQMETLLFQVVPRFPNLRALDFKHPANIKVMAEILKRKNLETINPSKSLQFVSFTVILPSGIDEVMKESMLTFLKALNTVENMDFNAYDFCTSMWEYAMIQNMAGRRLVEGNGVRDEANSLPISVWPILFQRIQQKIEEEAQESLWKRLEKGVTERTTRYDYEFWVRRLNSFERKTSAKATGIYYLLREGYALIGYKGPVDSPRKCRKRQRREY